MPRTTTRAKARANRKPNEVHRKIARRKAARKKAARKVGQPSIEVIWR
jgi:hypothetical protein